MFMFMSMFTSYLCLHKHKNGYGHSHRNDMPWTLIDSKIRYQQKVGSDIHHNDRLCPLQLSLYFVIDTCLSGHPLCCITLYLNSFFLLVEWFPGFATFPFDKRLRLLASCDGTCLKSFGQIRETFHSKRKKQIQ
jgi:hypothetical protein